jgi:hypothetical protein
MLIYIHLIFFPFDIFQPTLFTNFSSCPCTPYTEFSIIQRLSQSQRETLRPTVSRPVYLGVKRHVEPQTRFSLLSVVILLMRAALSEERMVLPYTIKLVLASAAILESESRVTHDQILLFQILDSSNQGQSGSSTSRQGFPFSSPPTTRRATVQLFQPTSTQVSKAEFFVNTKYFSSYLT